MLSDLVFQEGHSFHVHSLKLVKIVFMRNAKILHPLCKKVLISMQLMRMVNKRILNDINSLNALLVFRREPLTHQIHLLKKAIKVKFQGINLLLIKLISIMINMENSHIIFEENLHVHFMVWITIMFEDVGRR